MGCVGVHTVEVAKLGFQFGSGWLQAHDSPWSPASGRGPPSSPTIPCSTGSPRASPPAPRPSPLRPPAPPPLSPEALSARLRASAASPLYETGPSSLECQDPVPSLTSWEVFLDLSFLICKMEVTITLSTRQAIVEANGTPTPYQTISTLAARGVRKPGPRPGSTADCSSQAPHLSVCTGGGGVTASRQERWEDAIQSRHTESEIGGWPSGCS